MCILSLTFRAVLILPLPFNFPLLSGVLVQSCTLWIFPFKPTLLLVNAAQNESDAVGCVAHTLWIVSLYMHLCLVCVCVYVYVPLLAVYASVSVYVYVYASVSVYVCVCVCICVYVYVCLYVYASVYMCLCLCMCVCVSLCCLCLFLYICVFVYIGLCLWLYMCLCLFAHVTVNVTVTVYVCGCGCGCDCIGVCVCMCVWLWMWLYNMCMWLWMWLYNMCLYVHVAVNVTVYIYLSVSVLASVTHGDWNRIAVFEERSSLEWNLCAMSVALVGFLTAWSVAYKPKPRDKQPCWWPGGAGCLPCRCMCCWRAVRHTLKLAAHPSSQANQKRKKMKEERRGEKEGLLTKRKWKRREGAKKKVC